MSMENASSLTSPPTATTMRGTTLPSRHVSAPPAASSSEDLARLSPPALKTPTSMAYSAFATQASSSRTESVSP